MLRMQHVLMFTLTVSQKSTWNWHVEPVLCIENNHRNPTFPQKKLSFFLVPGDGEDNL